MEETLEETKELNLYTLVSKYRRELMGFAALWVVFYHVWETIESGITPLYYLELAIWRPGFCGVDIFFFLSGLGLVHAFNKRKSLGQFYLRRLKRVILPYWTFALIKNIIFGLSVSYFFYTIFFVPYFTVNIYFQLWFVPSILIVYLVFPLYYSLLKKCKNPTLFTVIAIFVALVFSQIAPLFIREDFCGFINRIPIILLGIYFGHVNKDTKLKLNSTAVLSAILSFIIGEVLLYMVYFEGFSINPSSDCRTPALLIGISSIVIMTAIFTKANKYVLNVFKFLGGFSLELYCVQEISAFYIRAILHQFFPTAICSIINIFCTIAIGYAFHLLCVLIEQIFKKIIVKVKGNK